MNAILTRYLGPTDHHGSRIVATADATRGRLVMPYRSELGTPDNHRAAAEMLLARLGWNDDPAEILVSGYLPGGDYCHVLHYCPKEPAR